MPVGSPFQQNFHVAGSGTGGTGGGTDDDDDRPEDFRGALSGSMAGCGDNALRCSCSDCPSGGGCEAPVRGGVGEGERGRGCESSLDDFFSRIC